jgi:meso-butanediol dehydrogenase/(S,S)-butanediol dehydrogenase/diacetyl reductase
MAHDGARLLLADVNGDGVKTLADELGQASIQVEVTRAADIQRMLDLAFQRWGRIDVLFNNAGIAEVRSLFELTEDEWDRMLAVNLRAVLFRAASYCCDRLFRLFLKGVTRTATQNEQP